MLIVHILDKTEKYKNNKHHIYYDAKMWWASVICLLSLRSSLSPIAWRCPVFVFFSANFFACSNFVVSVETSTSFHDSYTPTTAPYRPQIIDWSKWSTWAKIGSSQPRPWIFKCGARKNICLSPVVQSIRWEKKCIKNTQYSYFYKMMKISF